MPSNRVHRCRTALPVAVAVVLLVFVVSFCWSENVEHIPSKAEARDYQEMKIKTAAKDENEAVKSSETWTEWAKEKISGGLGLKNERQEEDGVKKVIDFSSVAAEKGKDKMENTASEAGHCGAEKAREMKDTAAEKAGEAKDKAAEKTTEATEKTKDHAYNAAKAAKEKTTSLKNKGEEVSGEAAEKTREAEAAVKKKTEETTEAAKGKGKEAKESAEETAARAEEAKEKLKSWAKDGYEAAKEKLGEQYEAAKEKMGEQYEAAKKKSQRIKDDVVWSEADVGVDDEL